MGINTRAELAAAETAFQARARAEALAGRQVVAERTPLLGAGIKVRVLGADQAQEAPRGAPPALPAVADLLELTAERRARLVAYVEGNSRLPEEARQRMLAQLSQDRVPAQVVERLEQRMGG